MTEKWVYIGEFTNDYGGQYHEILTEGGTETICGEWGGPYTIEHARIIAAAPATAADRDALKVTVKDLAKMLGTLLFQSVADEHGRGVAQALMDNNWEWPDDAPCFISARHEFTRALLASVKKGE